MRELRIGVNDAGQRLDKFLSKALKNLPQSLLYKSIRLKKIKVNRKRATPSQILAEGDSLQLFLAEEFFGDGAGRTAHTLASVRPCLDVLYEDENILLLNKRPGVSVHEGEEGDGETLIGQVQAYLFQKGEYDPAREQAFAPALCNRIDRNTAGIVIAAKNAEALRVMDEKIRLRQIQKYYLCVTHGIPTPREATLTAYLERNEGERKVRIYDKPPAHAENVKKIVTRYRVLRARGALALLEVELLTGRTHQIRAHLAHIGHPLLGDGKYGVNRADRARGYSYQALCSYRLRFAFEGEPTALDYLSGREFSVPREQIYFVKELFPEGTAGQ